MRILHLIAAGMCVASVIFRFDGGGFDALNGALAVINFGMFLRA